MKRPQSPSAALLLAGLTALCCRQAAADSFKLAFRAEVPAPERPVLTLTAEEPLRAVRLDLRPGPAEDRSQPGAESPETAAQRFTVPPLQPGQAHTLRIGSGKPGRTLWTGSIEYQAGGKLHHSELRFETLVVPQLKITHDPRLPSEHLDLDAHYIEVKASQPVERAEVTVLAEDGTELGRGQARFADGKAGTWLRVPWTQKPGTVLQLNLAVYDRGGFPHKISLTPWLVHVPHEEVNFATDSWDIPPAERGKLDTAYQRITEIVERVKSHINPRLYVAGHTDTVGTDEHNTTLSLNRARAIAAYFRDKGLKAPVLYAGFGERALKVSTADNVDEPRNRRADYVLALDAPHIGPPANWQRLQ